MFQQSSLSQEPASQNSAYIFRGTLQGHQGAILCLSATDDGKLASGGIDGIRLWDLSTMKPLEGPVGVGHRGATTALVWIRRDVELDHGLIYGTQNGFLICWKEKKAEDAQVFEEVHCGIVANPGEITGLAFASSSSQLAVCNRNSVVQLFAIDANMKPRVVFSVTIDDYVPKAIAFKQSAGERREILTFGLHDGRIHTLHDDGKVVDTWNTGAMVGDAAVIAKHSLFCVDDPIEGISLHRLDSGARVRTYPIAVTKSIRPRQVAFAEGCSKIVSGSDHGIVYVFDREGSTAEKLKIESEDWIQTVMATNVNGLPVILAAKTQDNGGRYDIYVWRKSVNERAFRVVTVLSRTLYTIVMICLCILFATLTFIFQRFS